MNSKVGLLISDLTQKEYTLLVDSMMSGLVGGKTQHLTLLEFIRKYSDDRELIRKNLFDNNLSDNQMRVLLTELYKMVSNFIVMLVAKEDDYYINTTLLRRFRNLDNHKLFESQLKSSKKKIARSMKQDNSYHQFVHEISVEEYNYISSKSRTQDLNIQRILDGVDIQYIGEKLKQACFAVSHNAVYGQEYNYGLLKDMLSYIEKKNLDVPVIRLYYSCYLMLSNPKEDGHLDAFIHNIRIYSHHFGDSELLDIYRFAINQCIRNINRGKMDYGSQALELYKVAMDKKLLLKDGYLSRFTYRNIAAIAIKIGDYSIAEDYSEAYKSYLRKDEKESAYQFNRALISYHNGDHDTALQSIQKVDFKDFLFNLAAKVIQLKIYYESNEYDLLYSHLDAMQMYILRKKVIGYHKTNYKNIIKHTQRLLKVNPNDKLSLEKLKTKVETEEVLTEKKWLLERVEEKM